MKYLNFCLIAIGSLILSSGSIKTDSPSIGYHPGERIPNIVLNDAEGKTLDLSEYKGKKVVVNFWAAYDAQSRATNIQIHNYLKNNYPDIQLLSVSFDENKGVFEKTVLWDQLETNSQFCDAKGTQSEIYKDFQLNKGFKNYLIDENGVITAMNVTPGELKTIL
ncbi:MAG: redoxin domain-containing protein [Petrimonas sp.]|nr:redoxin domain-containing protein [Petrimonas sp.]